MKLRFKWRSALINLLVSLAISLIVNFSYFVMMIMSPPTAVTEGRHYRYFNPLENTGFLSMEVLYYVLLAFILLTILTVRLDREKISSGSYWKRLLVCVVVAVGMYFLAPYIKRSGDINIIMTGNRIFNPMVVLKCSFTLVVAVLYGKIYELIYQKQSIGLENERLRNENLQSRYDVLVNQINPHFFFNSLNSLSMLVREKHNEGALTYIDRLSDTFRYILEAGRRNMTTLEEELRFANDYKYLFEIRYEGKFFLGIDVDEGLYDRLLPSLSLQPLIENAVKHNSITRTNPLRISITSEGDYLVISNPIAPKIGDEGSNTGIGLKNISSRYKLLTGKDIVVLDDGNTFIVKLPLISQ